MKIHYDQVGTLPWCEEHRDTLEELMEKALSGDENAELLVVNCAAHFYGLVIWDFESIKDLISAIHEVDYEQQAR